MINAVIAIPGNRRWMKISSLDGSVIYFEGDEEQADRVAYAFPPQVGDEYYCYSSGELRCENGINIFKVLNGAGLGADIELYLQGGVVFKLSLIWR